MPKLDVFTIGFTQTTAERFFERLRSSGAKRVVDVRLHNTSQLAGFAKSDDLAYFLRAIGKIDYVHEPLLAPTEPLMTFFKKEEGDWPTFRKRFTALMAERAIEKALKPSLFDGACLLCSESKPYHCHRQIVCDYLNEKWSDRLEVRHL